MSLSERSQCHPERSEGTKMNNPIVEIFRGATRPVVTVIFAAVIAQVVIDRIDAPQWFLGLASGCILWWFGDRTVQHIKEKKKEQS